MLRYILTVISDMEYIRDLYLELFGYQQKIESLSNDIITKVTKL